MVPVLFTFYIFIQQIYVPSILNMVYTLRFFFSSKCSLFHNSNLFGSCIIHILYTGCAIIKKIIPAPKGSRISYVRGTSSYQCDRFFKSFLVCVTAGFRHEADDSSALFCHNTLFSFSEGPQIFTFHLCIDIDR